MFGDSQWSNLRSALIGAVVAAVVLLTFPAAAAVGDALKLGQGNSADAVTSLSGSSTASLQITNTRSSSPALDLRVVSGSAPFKVNSTTKVLNLNADRLDGKHASYYLPATGVAADSDLLDGHHSGEFAWASHSHDAGDIQSGTLDGAYFSAYDDLNWEGRLDNDAGGDLLTRTQADARYVNEVDKAPDADLLDGLDSTAFLSSQADTILYVPAVGLRVDVPGTAELYASAAGPVGITVQANTAGTVRVTLPITVPAMQSGRWVRIVSLRVFYRVTAGESIAGTYLRRTYEGTSPWVMAAIESPFGTAQTTYTVDCISPTCQFDESDDGVVVVSWTLSFTGTSAYHQIEMFGVALQLSYD